MSFCADDVEVAFPLFQAEWGGSTPTSALQLKIHPLDSTIGMKLNQKWHSRLPEIGNGMQCFWFGAEFGNIWYAVAAWSNPVARMFNGRNLLELRRMAISDSAPQNTGSRMISVMVSMIKKTRPEIRGVISYQDTEVHSGTIYKASGWTKVETKGQTKWNMPNRSRKENPSSGVRKIRWEKHFNKSP